MEGPTPEPPILGVRRLSLDPEGRSAVIHRAVERGIRWFETSDVEGRSDGDAERWLGALLRGVPGARIATRGGLVRQGDRLRPEGRARHLEGAARASRDRLGVDAIALYQLEAPDPRTPFQETARALGRLRASGVVRSVGLCDVTVGQLLAALDELPIASVQVELSPLRPRSVHSGIVEAAQERGIRVLARRPLGGVDGIHRLRRDPLLRELSSALDRPPEQLVLAWLLGLEVIPLAGPTRAETVDGLIEACALTLDPQIKGRLDARFEPGRIAVPRARREAPPDPEREVVIVMGSPGAGKTTRIGALNGTHLRLNRDQRGGTLADLLPALDRALGDGIPRVVLDNTYPSRASRNPVIETAWAHRVPVRCEWLTTPEGEAEVNVCARILDRLGRLPSPEEIPRLQRTDPSILPPQALYRYRSELEPPTLDEGFARVDPIPFVRAPCPASGRAAVISPRDLEQRAAEVVALAERGFRPISIGWDPEGRGPWLSERARALGLDLYEALCPHPRGGPPCWCRKPLPGLLVLALRRTGCDPRRSVALGTETADRQLATRVGVALASDRGQLGLGSDANRGPAG